MEKRRHLWIDYANILACIGVVQLHTCSWAVHGFNGELTSYYIWSLISISFLCWPVNIFFMMSGATLMGKDCMNVRYATRRIRRTLIPYLFWSALYFLINGGGSLWQFRDGILSGSCHPNLWFFIPLFVLYLYIPFINFLLDRIHKNQLELMLAIGFVCSIVIPFLEEFYGRHIIPDIFPLTLNFNLVALLGYYINYYTKQKKLTIPILIAFGLCIIKFIETFAYDLSIGQHNSLTMGFLTPIAVLVSIFIFYCFKHINWMMVSRRLNISNQMLEMTSSCSLGIYLIHPLVLFISQKYHLYLSNPFVGFILVYSISLISTYIIKKIPILRWIVA